MLNSTNYAKVQEILIHRTKKTRNPGGEKTIPFGLEINLNLEDIEFFDTALVSDRPELSTHAFEATDDFAGAIHNKARHPDDVLSAAAIHLKRNSQSTAISRFAEAATHYFFDKLSRLHVMVGIKEDDTVVITAQPYTMPNLAKLTAHVDKLQNDARKRGQDGRV